MTFFYRSRLCRTPNSEKVKMALSVELWRKFWWNFAYTLILTRCSQWDCQMVFGIGRGLAEIQILKKVKHAQSLEPFGKFVCNILPIQMAFDYFTFGKFVCNILSKYSKWFKSYISLFSEFEPRQNLDRSELSAIFYQSKWHLTISLLVNLSAIFYQNDLDRGIAKSSQRDCKLIFNIGRGCAELQILKKWKWPNWVDFCAGTLHTNWYWQDVAQEIVKCHLWLVEALLRFKFWKTVKLTLSLETF